MSTAWGVLIGMVLLGLCVDNGLTNIARAIKFAAAVWQERKNEPR